MESGSKQHIKYYAYIRHSATCFFIRPGAAWMIQTGIVEKTTRNNDYQLNWSVMKEDNSGNEIQFNHEIH